MSGEIFLVDDNPNNLALLVGILRAASFQVRVANSGRRAIEMIQARPPELVLLDISMPDMNGYEVCQSLKSDAATSGIPVLFISANDDPVDKVRAFGVGGVDYIPKPFQAEEVIARVNNHLVIRRLQMALQERTARLEEALRELAEASVTDPLTGLRNRRFLLQNIASEAAAARGLGTDIGFFLIDIDHFKRVNDTYGHVSGDFVLTEMARRLRRAFAPSDHIVRWGGEEFLVMTREAGRATAAEVATRLLQGVTGEPFDLEGGQELSVSCSVGFASLPFFTSSPDVLTWQEVVDLADLGLYAVKRAGRNGWAGLTAGGATPVDHFLARLRADPSEVARRGELRVATSLDHDSLVAALTRNA